MVAGLRFGATLAHRAASLIPESVNSIVSWEPLVDPAEYLLRLRALHARMLDLWVCKMETENNDQREEILGSLYSRELIREIEALGGQEIELDQPQLVFELATQEPLAKSELRRHITVDDEDGWNDLSQLEIAWLRPKTLRTIVTSIDDMFQRLERFGVLAAPTAFPNVTGMPLDGIGNGSGTMNETICKFGPEEGLFGILTTPSHDRKVNGAPIAIILNAGVVHRIGPFRLHVVLARQLAEQGFSTLRMDLSGLGDSQPRKGKINPEQRAELDVRDAMDFLTKQTTTQRVCVDWLVQRRLQCAPGLRQRQSNCRCRLHGRNRVSYIRIFCSPLCAATVAAPVLAKRNQTTPTRGKPKVGCRAGR